MIDLDPPHFAAFFQTMIESGASDEELDAVDDAIQKGLDGDQPNEAAACALIAVNLLSTVERPWPLAYALNTRIAQCCSSGDVEGARLGLDRLVELTIEHETDLAPLSAAENVRQLLPGNATPDQVPHLLHPIVRLYTHLDMVDKAIETLITAAHLFADYGAFQTAYRSIADAEDLARQHGLIEPFANALGAMHSICLLEGDHTYAEEVWNRLTEVHADLRKPVPSHLAVNRATALMQTGKYDLAKDAFETALAATRPENELQLAILMNLSACLRELGDPAQSDERMAQGRRLLANLDLARIDSEHLLELELIAAMNAVKSNRATDLAACLGQAALHLDSAILLVDKLHYRRGLRDRYVGRMERLLAALPATGSAAHILAVIASTRSNQLTDWLHLLDWSNDISTQLTEGERQELNDLVFRLANFGAPHLLGYREKYDDPMAPNLVPDPWRAFTEYAGQLCSRYGFRRPFANSTNHSCMEMLKQRLDSGYGILVNLLTAGSKTLLLIGERYVMCCLPEAETKEFYLALNAHRHEPNRSKQLSAAVEAYQAALVTALVPILEAMSGSGCRGVIFLPDRMDLTPINLITIAYPAIRSKMAAGHFEVRTCLALHPRNETSLPLSTGVGVIESTAGLRYDRAEVESFFKLSGVKGVVLVDPVWKSFSSHMKAGEVLMLSHHGMSIGLFADPSFANLSGPSGDGVMWFDSIQQSAYLWPHRLVILGTCHSGGLVSRNAQGNFKSHELAGFPSVFLVNGRCIVLAASWAVLDRFNILLSVVFAEELKNRDAAGAFSCALAKLYEMSTQRLVDLLNSVSSASSELTTQNPVSMDTVDALRRRAFCYGAYQLYSLL